MDRITLANAYHDNGFNCAQSVFAAFCDLTGIEEKTALKIAGGFGGGVKVGEICGAASGAVMVIGALFPHVTEKDMEEKKLVGVAECGEIPQTTIKTRDNLVKLNKRGRMLVASYEAIRFQKLDLFSVTLRQIGAQIGKMHLEDAVGVIINGDGNDNAAQETSVASAGTLTYDDLVAFWNGFDPYQMNTILVGSDTMLKLMKLSQMQDAAAGLDFHGTGKLITPMGAKVLRCSAVPEGKIIGLDKNYALEMVKAGDVMVEYDKIIDRQLERAAITTISGYAKIFEDASAVLAV